MKVLNIDVHQCKCGGVGWIYVEGYKRPAGVPCRGCATGLAIADRMKNRQTHNAETFAGSICREPMNWKPPEPAPIKQEAPF